MRPHDRTRRPDRAGDLRRLTGIHPTPASSCASAVSEPCSHHAGAVPSRGEFPGRIPVLSRIPRVRPWTRPLLDPDASAADVVLAEDPGTTHRSMSSGRAEPRLVEYERIDHSPVGTGGAAGPPPGGAADVAASAGTRSQAPGSRVAYRGVIAIGRGTRHRSSSPRVAILHYCSTTSPGSAMSESSRADWGVVPPPPAIARPRGPEPESRCVSGRSVGT